MGNRKLFIRIVCIVLAALMALSVLISILSSLMGSASYVDDIQRLEQEREALTQQQQELDARIQELKTQNISALSMKVVLDEQISLTQQELDNIDKQISIYRSLSATWEERIASLQAQVDDNLRSNKLRLRAIEENGTVMYYSVLFGAVSVQDFIDRLYFVMEIRRCDQELYNNVRQYSQMLQDAQDEMDLIQQQITDLGTQRIILEAKIEVEVEEATTIIKNVQSNIELYQSDFDEMTEAEKQLQENVGSMLEALQRQESTIATIGTGDFIWPCLNSRVVISQYGTRMNAAYNILKYHSGVDIEAPYGTSVLAVDGGTVVTAAYDPAFGYYMIINHGNGHTSMYAHLGKISSPAGSQVVQGQVIGIVGASGVADQCHLHFEVSEGGVRVNPLTFFSNYTVR